MNRQKIIDDIDILLQHHKRGTALEEDYTKEIYDFLVEEGFIALTKEQKWAIFEVAKQAMKEELLQRKAKTKRKRELKTINAILLRLDKNIPAPTQMNILQNECRKMCLKYYLNNIKNDEEPV